MQHRIHGMIGYAIRATDGDLGKVHDFYFDDATWTIRYMVADTGNWLSGRKVLISPVAMGKPDEGSHAFPVNLTRVQVSDSPDIDTEKPVYRQHEAKLHEYYQWPPYWEGGYGGIFGITSSPVFEIPVVEKSPDSEQRDDPHLRSTRQVTGYHIKAIDGEIGHVTDFIVDDENWMLPYMVVDTGNWLPGKKLLISPQRIKSVNWVDASVSLDRMRDSIKNSPELDSLKPDYNKKTPF